MAIDVVSPIGRFVQGSLTLETKNDPQTNKPKLDADGQPIKECFIALAIRKDDPGLPAFYQAIVDQAKAEFGHLFNAQGQMTHPQFAWKIQDGDGTDYQGKSVADKEGWPGHWIFKMATRYLPRCFHAGKYDPTQMIQNPEQVIKRGYYIRVNVRVSGNGVKADDRLNKPGMYLSPNLIELVAYGQEIIGGPDASKAFGSTPLPAHLPPGASPVPVGAPAAPVGGMPQLAPPPQPGVALPPPGGVPVALPGLHPAMPAATGLPAIGGPAIGPPAPHLAPPPPVQLAPPVPTGPVYQMTASAMGATREQLHAQQWTDELLLQHGHMVRIG